ncbi:MAG: phytanoyl-CoA dioxygenase family protein [Alphaproteobacteria bacterium]|nr:phytanoyl-CoA dioxygenase family protein [Alphaproteobacteria bacterium]
MDRAYQQLCEDGYCVIERVLEDSLLDDISRLSSEALRATSSEHRTQNRSQGSLINVADYPGYAPLIGHARARGLFEQLLFADPRFSSGYLISKPPSGPALFWHQDWWGWDDPISYSDEIAQVFFMYYLTDTTPENGCLRVLSGSHRRRHALHDADAAHGESLSRVDDPNDPLYGSINDEVPVPVRAGDLVIGDARLLHSAYANRSDQERSLITLWFHPNFRGLPAGMRARIRQVFDRQGVDTDPGGATAMTLDDWPEASKRQVADLFPPPLRGIAPHAWNRTPDWEGGRTG